MYTFQAFRPTFPVRVASFLVCLFLLLSGCGTTLSGTAGDPAPAVSLTATPATIAPGSSATLTVSASNAEAITVNGSDGTSYTMAASGGTQSIHPAKTTIYTATATENAKTASATATVTVAANPAASPSVNLAANPTSIPAGSSSSLTVSAANATQVTVSGSDGTSFTLPAAGGTQTVTPPATTTYTASASGPGGKATTTATVTVTANPAPSVTIGANPGAITASGSSTLTVAATHAAQVMISGSDGSSYTLPGTGGAQAVSPAATATYTATATGPGGKATAAATVTVTANPAPAVTITASPTAITASRSSLITVSAANATQVTLSGSDGTSYALPTTGGTQAVSPASTTTYTVLATGPGGKTGAAVTVTVAPNPAPSVTLVASPVSTTAGSASTLSITSDNATQITITGSDGSSYTLPSSSAQQSVSPGATTTYTATATGPGGQATAVATVSVTPFPVPSATISANPSSIVSGNSATLTVTATNDTQVTIAGSDGSSYTLPKSGGSQSVSPTSTVIYTATVTGQGGHTTAQTTVTVTQPGSGSAATAVDHVIFMLQENHSFDNYFGMLNPYRAANGYSLGDDGKTYTVDGIDDKLGKLSNQDDEGATFPLFKLSSTCVDDETSSWLESYGQVSRYDFTPARGINMDGFVHTAENFAKFCSNAGNGGQCAGSFTDMTGQRAMGYYDQGFLNYYYYMASNFAISDRWFTPVSSKSTPNRIATFTGGTTQGLVFDPFNDDGLQGQLTIPTIFKELETAGVTWKVYYTVTDGGCLDEDDCSSANGANYPATDFTLFADSYPYLHRPSPEETANGKCDGSAQFSSVVGDKSNSFCIDINHVAPLSQYFQDLNSGNLPSFAFIEAGYGVDDEHPGSGQSILRGQAEVANIVNQLMSSSSWKDSIFFLAYDEAGGPFDHVPPVPNHSNDYTDANLASGIPELSSANIAVNADIYNPCPPPTVGSPTFHCDLASTDPGFNPADAPAQQGFAAQLGFRVPNMVISPFSRRHYVSHIPMDHTAILKFVESRFIGSSAHLTNRDAAQPNLTDFFDFSNNPWATPPTPPIPYADPSGSSSCRPANFAPATH